MELYFPLLTLLIISINGNCQTSSYCGYNITAYVNHELHWDNNDNVPADNSQFIKYEATIGPTGKILKAMVLLCHLNNYLNNQFFITKASEILINSPKWIPAKGEYGNPIESKKGIIVYFTRTENLIITNEYFNPNFVILYVKLARNITNRQLIEYPDTSFEVVNPGNAKFSVQIDTQGDILKSSIITADNSEIAQLSRQEIKQIKFNADPTAPQAQFGEVIMEFKPVK